jgi:hypothetical protein
MPIQVLTEYINGISAISTIGQCASSGLVSVVDSLTTSLCAAPPTALVSCACFKNGNSAMVSAAISSTVAQSCGTTDIAQITGALDVFSTYCSMAVRGNTIGLTGTSSGSSGKVVFRLFFPLFWPYVTFN